LQIIHLISFSNKKRTDSLSKGVSLDAKIRVFYPENHETTNVVIPWNSQQFQYTEKHNSLPASGYVKIHNKNDGKNTFFFFSFYFLNKKQNSLIDY